MTTAAADAEYKSNIGHDFSLADAYDPEYLDEETEEGETAARQELNRRMSDWFGM
jgi:hypothetical protein